MKKWILFLIFISCKFSFSQNSENDYWGFGVNYHNIINNVEFKQLPGIPNCCPIFREGQDYNLSFVLFYKYNIGNDFNIQTNLRYLLLSGKFVEYEKELFGYNNGVIEGEFKHDLNTNFKIISILPSINYNLDKFSLSLGFGLNYLFDTFYEQKESISKPDNLGTFLDSNGNDTGSRVRNQNSGKINIDNQFGISIIPSLSYSLTLNKNLNKILELKIGSELFLNDIAKPLNWKTYNFFIGLSINFKIDNNEYQNYPIIPEQDIKPLPILKDENFSERKLKINNKEIFTDFIELPDTNLTYIKLKGEQEKFKKGQIVIEYDTVVITKRLQIRKSQYRIDTLSVKNDSFLFDFDLIGMNNNEKSKVDKIEINEKLVVNEFTNCNTVYFYENSSDIYLRDMEFLNTNYENIFKKYLNKLKNNKNNKINLIAYKGYDSDKSLNLIQKRIENLKKFINENTHINENAIEIQIDSLEYKNENLKNELIRNERRRIEIINSEINENFVPDTIIVKETNPEKIIFNLNFPNSKKIKKLFLEIYSDTVKIKSLELDITSNTYLNTYEIIKDLNEETNFLKFKIIAIDLNNVKFDQEKLIKISYNSIEKRKILELKNNEIFVQNLYFDYNSYKIDQYNLQLLEKLLHKNIEVISIEGYSDDIGDIQFNQKLSYQRALEVAKFLNVNQEKAKGLGIKQNNVNTNSLIKRFSRVVQIKYRYKD